MDREKQRGRLGDEDLFSIVDAYNQLTKESPLDYSLGLFLSAPSHEKNNIFCQFPLMQNKLKNKFCPGADQTDHLKGPDLDLRDRS